MTGGGERVLPAAAVWVAMKGGVLEKTEVDVAAVCGAAVVAKVAVVEVVAVAMTELAAEAVAEVVAGVLAAVLLFPLALLACPGSIFRHPLATLSMLCGWAVDTL